MTETSQYTETQKAALRAIGEKAIQLANDSDTRSFLDFDTENPAIRALQEGPLRRGCEFPDLDVLKGWCWKMMDGGIRKFHGCWDSEEKEELEALSLDCQRMKYLLTQKGTT